MASSQSSSAPLQTSAGGLHSGQPQEAVQVCVPVEPQSVVQSRVVPAAQAAVSSTFPSQSSSPPPQTSAGGTQEPQPHSPPQVRVPKEPQLVAQSSVSPGVQSVPSSTFPSQSSSLPLSQLSVGGAHAPKLPPLQVALPVVPQLVMHARLVPSSQGPGGMSGSSTVPRSAGPRSGSSIGPKSAGPESRRSSIGTLPLWAQPRATRARARGESERTVTV